MFTNKQRLRCPRDDCSSCLIALHDGKRDSDSDRGVSVRAGDRAVLVRAIFPGLLSDYPHLHYLVGFEDNSEETAGLPLGV